MKDLRALTREKTIVFTLLLLISLSSLSQIIATGLTLLYNPMLESNINVGLVGRAPVFESIAHPVKFESMDSAMKYLRKGYVDAVVVVNESVERINYIEVYIPKEEVKAVKIIPSLRKIFQRYQDALRELNGIPTLNIRTYDLSGKPVKVPEGVSIQFRFVYVVLIPTMVILCGIIMGMYTIDILYEERRCIDVLLSSVSLKDVILGKIIATAIVSVLLTIVWISGLIINGTEINMVVAIPSIMFCMFSSFIAMLVFGFSENREEAQLTYSLIFIPLVLSFLTFNPSPLSLIVKFSLSIFDVLTVTFTFIFFIVNAFLLLISLKVVERAITKNL